MKINLSFPTCLILLNLLSSSTAVADLLVIRADNGQTSPVVLRLNDRTGAFIDEFGHESEAYEGLALSGDGQIYVTSNTLGYGDVYRFDRSGQFLGQLTNGTLRTPGNLTFGPDGNCYVIGSNWPESPEKMEIIRYNSAGLFLGNFVSDAGSPQALAFGPDGWLYVADAARGIVRYDGATGAFLGTFVPFGTGGLRDPQTFIFGADQNLYVCSHASNAVFRFRGTDGASLGAFVAPSSGGLSQPGGIAFGPDGNLYVSSTATHRILRYDGRTGAFIDVFAAGTELLYPTSLVFLPPATRLKITPSPGRVTVSWPSAAGNWKLFSRHTTDPTAPWNLVTNAPTVVGTNCVLTQPCADPACFYRLEQR
jgi:sugar lactone lactonase YvrE